MGDPSRDPDHAKFMIGSIRSLAELDGYERQAKTRGISPHEIKLIHDKKKLLTPKKKKRK